MKLSQNAEEAATFFGKMLDHDYTKKDIFCQNFFTDWRKVGKLIVVGVAIHLITPPSCVGNDGGRKH